jgi:hypothetical protein
MHIHGTLLFSNMQQYFYLKHEIITRAKTRPADFSLYWELTGIPNTVRISSLTSGTHDLALKYCSGWKNWDTAAGYSRSMDITSRCDK